MRRIVVLVIAALFFSALFRETTMATTLMLACAMASAYVVSRLQERYLLAAKYPLIGLCLILSPVLVVYPDSRSLKATAAVAMLLAFYSIALFLVTIEEKGRKIHKEVIGLSVLYGSSACNLFLTGHLEAMLPLSVSTLLFLFIINRVKIMPVAAAYGVACAVFLAATGGRLSGPDVQLHDAGRYALFACAFALLLIAFVAFLKRTDFTAVLAFFGLVYVSVDLLLSVGFRLNGVLLYEPVLGLCVVGPLVGTVMKGGKEHR